MIDPLLTLSFNVHAQKGTYALLLGSGVSRSASIPTGWEITLNLVSKLAHLHEEDCEGDEAGWYLEKFKKEPDYSELLATIAPTSAAQQQLLKQYFEPSDEEREEGKKLPTVAHKAIAQLVATGHIRVIVTTNFDRLIENALEGEGIAPIVIASPDAAKGAPPLAHSKCTVIKVHGDYLDHRIKNSLEALSKYAPPMNRLLDQIFDEYGLICCGWSADYDLALRKALERSKTRRYPMYWTGRSDPGGQAKKLISLHSADFIKIKDADGFFPTLLEKVGALEEFDRPHPVTTQAAVVTLKRYLSEEKYRIRLRDFLVAEAGQAGSAIDTAFSHMEGVAPDKHSVGDLMLRLEASCEKLIHIFANGSFFARPSQARSFFDAFHLIIGKAVSTGGYQVWTNIRRYPALLLVYAAGIAAVVSENYSVLHEIASRPSFIKHDDDKSVVAPVRIYTHNVMDRDHARKLIEGMAQKYTPVSDYLSRRLRDPLRILIPDDTQYERAFDDFEYLWCLLHVDAEKELGRSDIWTPYGAFIWKHKERDVDWLAMQARNAIGKSDKSWPPLGGGLFGGSLERLSAVLEEAEPKLKSISEKMR
ncbi:MAG: hypothetical protein FD165_1504 [Gammaproteobacteria bacterium]|nr:MAG: hypothetical protein FD165_1504 [Gammaproteobacteria bacterium]TND02485.1 MAG: hypothetical protein FD120_2226 [Gammaproteobacteria bacterium]